MTRAKYKQLIDDGIKPRTIDEWQQVYSKYLRLMAQGKTNKEALELSCKSERQMYRIIAALKN